MQGQWKKRILGKNSATHEGTIKRNTEVERFGAMLFGLRPHTQSSTFGVEKAHTAHIK